MTLELFNLIIRMHGTTSKAELCQITNLSITAVNKAIRFIEETPEDEKPDFNLYSKPKGRKKKDKDFKYTAIRKKMGEDNSLTLRGCAEQLDYTISVSQMSRDVRAAGLKRKRLRKRANVLLSERNISARRTFCAEISGRINKRILFLDESGFNLHTSCNYGYSMAGTEPVLYQPASRQKNISLLAIVSISRVDHFKLKEGAYNTESFLDFLVECNNNTVFTDNTVLVMDNVKFHHAGAVKTFLKSLNVEVIYLPPYSPDLNPIENLFSSIKANLNAIRPRASTKSALIENIANVIESSGSLAGFYRSFWRRVHKVLNGQQ